MTAVVLLLALLSWADSQLVSEPVPHLTPPHLQPLTRMPRNDSSASASSNEPLHQEARAIAWASPTGSLRDCNPCDKMPWVPIARSLQAPQYALSIPAIQLTLPVNYGIPMAPINSPHNQHIQQSESYGSPPPLPPQQRPPQQYGSPSQVYQNYGLSPSAPDVGGAKEHSTPQNQYNPPSDETPGLPPPPLPQAFLSPTYGPPQPQTQFVSSTNLNPKATNAIPQRVPPPQMHQLLPSVRFGPPFDPKLLNSNSPAILSQSKNNITNIHQYPPPNSVRPLNQQFRDESGKRPTFLYNPIPFPAMSKTQLPPLFNYQTFSDGKQDHLHSYLQPPKPQNVVFTITETEDSCRKCQEQNHQKDSEPAQAEQVTESVVKTTEQYKTNSDGKLRRPAEQFKNPMEQDKSSVQIVKSVPIAEYLSSVEYPMQIIQAPILDVPDLSKYFNLGYSNFPQVQNFQGNKFHPKTPQGYNQQILANSQYLNHGSTGSSGTSLFGKASSTTPALDDVKISDDQTTNSLPPNHKLITNSDLGNYQTTDNTFSQSTPYHTNPTTKPSQIYHVTKSNPSFQPETSKQTTVPGSASSTSGHYVTFKPVTADRVTPTNPTPLLEPVHSSSQNHQATIATSDGLSPSGLSSLRHNDNGGIRDWTYARGPRPFVSPTASPHTARFSVRPTPAAPKKSKHVHQIIVPYTTYKQSSTVVREPTNTLGWSTIPPTNQGRKVPNLNFGDQFPSTTGSDQAHNYQTVFPSASGPSGPNYAFTSSGPDNIKQRPIFPTNHGQPLNLPPQVINHILHLNQQGTLWPTGPEGLQQLLVSNLQGLLRGEEDSIDIARLQKNIDNWTAEGYKQSAPSVNFIPVTTIPHIFHSKKIPDDYFTSTEPTSANFSQSRFPQHNFETDHEVAESQKHQIKVHPLSHSKDHERPEDTSESIESILNSWSLLDTKVTLPTPSTEVTTTSEPSSSEPTSKAWEKIQVSISPLTNEKVYVVTPVSITDSEPEENSTLLSTRVERSFSVKTSGKESSALEHS